MRRICVALAFLVLATFGANKAQASPSLDEFVISNYDVKLNLSKDQQNHSFLETTETITAEFMPEKNHGISRTFVKNYDGHSTDFNLISVKDEQGNDLDYHWSDDSLRIGKSDVFVSGTKTYVIKYSQRDVTKTYSDTDADEFYWDAVGTDWRVPIERAEVTVNLAENIKSDLKTELNCYYGKAGDSSRCGVDGMVASAWDLPVGAGLSIAVGFRPGTFVGYQKSWLEVLAEWWTKLQIIVIAPSIISGAIIMVVSNKMRGRKKDVGTIAPEYLPPKGASVSMSGKFGSRFSMMMLSNGTIRTAQIIDLAVRHYLKIYEVSQKKLFKPAEYELEVIKSLDSLLPEEREVVEDIFGGPVNIGDKINLKKLMNNQSYAKRLVDDNHNLDKLMQEPYGLIGESDDYKKFFSKIAIIVLVVGMLLLSPMVIALAILAYGLSRMKVASDKGVELRRYLEGLKMYIGVAEEDRLKMLQSPDTALKIGDDLSQPKIIKLYEKVLPYAILFGQEKEWSKQMGKYYETANSQPDWYSGSGAFNALAFSSGISALSSTTTYVDSSNSSSGGSSGGGFSGGGGGGGGGGGW